MNFTTSHNRSLAIPSAHFNSSRPPVFPHNSEPIESVESAIEETFIRLQTDPCFGAKKLISRAEFKNQIEVRDDESDDRPAPSAVYKYEVTLTEGSHATLFFGSSRRMLRRLIGRLGKSAKRRARGILVRIGECKAKLRNRVVESIQIIYHALTCILDPEEELRIRKRRQTKRRWNVIKNIQPQFV
jgi:hypothetical protein